MYISLILDIYNLREGLTFARVVRRKLFLIKLQTCKGNVELLIVNDVVKSITLKANNLNEKTPSLLPVKQHYTPGRQ